VASSKIKDLGSDAETIEITSTIRQQTARELLRPHNNDCDRLRISTPQMTARWFPPPWSIEEQVGVIRILANALRPLSERARCALWP